MIPKLAPFFVSSKILQRKKVLFIKRYVAKLDTWKCIYNVLLFNL